MRFWISWETHRHWADPLPEWKHWESGEGEDTQGPYGTMVALLDAPSEEAAWNEVRRFYPDARERFCDERPDLTLEKLAEGGRFA